MKRTLILILLWFALRMTSSAAPEMLLTVEQSVTVYQTNSLDSTIIATLPPGERVEAFETRLGWTMIRLSDSRVGYIEQSKVSVSTPSIPMRRLVNCGKGGSDGSTPLSMVRVRRTASVLQSLAEEPLVKLSCGDEVTVLDEEAQGIKIRTLDGIVGYVSHGQVAKTPQTHSEPVPIPAVNQSPEEESFANCLTKSGFWAVSVPISYENSGGMGRLQCGERVTIIYRGGGFSTIRTSSNKVGFVSTSMLSDQQVIPPPTVAVDEFSQPTKSTEPTQQPSKLAEFLRNFREATAAREANRSRTNFIPSPTAIVPAIAGESCYLSVGGIEGVIAGMNKICYYDCIGSISTLAINVSTTANCPLTIER